MGGLGAVIVPSRASTQQAAKTSSLATPTNAVHASKHGLGNGVGDGVGGGVGDGVVFGGGGGACGGSGGVLKGGERAGLTPSILDPIPPPLVPPPCSSTAETYAEHQSELLGATSAVAHEKDTIIHDCAGANADVSPTGANKTDANAQGSSPQTEVSGTAVKGALRRLVRGDGRVIEGMHADGDGRNRNTGGGGVGMASPDGVRECGVVSVVSSISQSPLNG